MKAVSTRPERRARTLHLVDIENLLGMNPRRATVHDVRSALGEYMITSGFRSGDQIIVGCNPQLTMKVEDSLRGSGRIRTRKGADGADLALLDCVNIDLWADRFDRVVIGSGDHIFASTVQQLLGAGLEVVIVALSGHVSIDLRTTASAFRPLGATRTEHRHIIKTSASKASKLDLAA